MKEHLGVDVSWEDLLSRWVRYADVRLSTYVQEHLNPRVGVVSFSTDVLVPTMWAHYARNTGIVVGYDRDALKALGFELRPVLYSEIAPAWEPAEGDGIRLDFVDREYVERDTRAGRAGEGWPVLTGTHLGNFGSSWRSLSRLLFVKGRSWAYEKEVRLLVDLKRAVDTGVEDCDGHPVKVIKPPPGGDKGNLRRGQDARGGHRASRSSGTRRPKERAVRRACVSPRLQNSENGRNSLLSAPGVSFGSGPSWRPLGGSWNRSPPQTTGANIAPPGPRRGWE